MSTTDHRVERYVDVDLYDVLHITAGASTALIERAYKMRVAEVHSDRVGAARTEQAALVNTAREILGQPNLRAQYDALRAERRPRTATAQDIPPGQPAGSNGTGEGRQALEQQLATARQQLAATQVELAATETRRRDLAVQLRWMAGQARSRPSRWAWASCGVGIILGAVSLSLVLGLAGGSQVRAAPYTPPLVVPAPAADVVASIGADAEWPATVHELDRTWEQDWPRTIAVLETFLGRWPDYVAAEDKLYAALVADGNAHVQGGEVSTGVDELERAARLLPGREEAWALLAQLATSGKT